MRQGLLVSLVSVVVLSFAEGCASYARAVPYRPPNTRPDAATLVLMQNGGFNTYLVVNGEGRFIGELSRGAWFETSVPPGEQQLAYFNTTDLENLSDPRFKGMFIPGVNAIGVRCLPVNVQAGKNYYLGLRFISPAHGQAVGGLLGATVELSEEGLDPGTPVPPSEWGWHMRVKRKREQMKMDPWGYLKDRKRVEPEFEAGQKAVDETLKKYGCSANPQTKRLSCCAPPGNDDSVAPGDFMQ